MFADDPRASRRPMRGIGRDLDDGDRDCPPTPAIAGSESRTRISETPDPNRQPLPASELARSSSPGKTTSSCRYLHLGAISRKWFCPV
jgi:hypothetical protein